MQSQMIGQAFGIVGDVVDVPQVLFRDVVAAAKRLVAQLYPECVRGPVVAESGQVHFAQLRAKLLAYELRSFGGRVDL